MIGSLPTQALAFLAVFVYATHATQAIAFEWKPGLTNSIGTEETGTAPDTPLQWSCVRVYSLAASAVSCLPA